LKEIQNFFSKKKRNNPLAGKRILVNAGPTREPIDPVRFISNQSSGRMGIAIADAAAEYGADVELVLGPVSLRPKNENISLTEVTTADEMAAECFSRFGKCDIAILSAAVADFSPDEPKKNKIKKENAVMVLHLRPTTDIAARLGEMKKPSQIIVGFALETDNELLNAKEKLTRKNMDLIVLNSLKEPGAGFEFSTNKVTLIDRKNNIDNFELKSKEEVARDILDKIITLFG
jgi:phosphopantothenoylcysteine decarboxylase / phosphopantothenate---cysteine ligase